MKLNLEPIFYNEDGSFKPIGRTDGTTDEKLKIIRNTFMTNEKEFFLELLDDPVQCGVLTKHAYNKSNDELFSEALDIMHKVEYDELETHEEKEMMKTMSREERIRYHAEKVYNAEATVCFLFAHAGDKTFRKSLYLFAKNPDEENFHLLDESVKYYLEGPTMQREKELQKKKVL